MITTLVLSVGCTCADYTVDCTSTFYLSFAVFVGVLIIVVPIGVPVIMLLILIREKRVAASAFADAEDDDQAEKPDLQTFVHEKMLAKWDFLIADYKYNFYYFEVLDLVKKLLLTGLLLFMDRGSVSQAYCGGLISMAFMLVHIRAFPYVNFEHNLLKLATELCTFSILFTTLVLKINLMSDEALSQNDYGLIMSSWIVVIVPAVNAVGLRYRFKALRDRAKEEAEDLSEATATASS
eukprot:SAG31_NODE_8571_length_1428_cov_1.437171_2_plen_236_part_01